MIASPSLLLSKNFSTLIALAAALVVTIGVVPGAEARRIGFANVARDGQAGKAAIEANRAYVVDNGSGSEIAAAEARAALEEPVAAGASEDAATVARARALVSGARAALKAFDYDEALDQLRQADAALRTLTPGPPVVADLYEVVLLAGQVYAAKGDETLALGAFQLARRLAPDKTALDPARYRPQVVALYARGDADAGAGSFHVVTEPPGASVFIDGRLAGSSPLELAGLGAGEHYLGLGLDGHASRHERILVGKGVRTEQSYLLARLPAEQRARSLRAGLARPGLTDADYRRGAALLADVASVDVLVLVRDKDGGGVEAASWDVHAARLSAWVTLGDGGRALVATLPSTDASAIAVPPPADVGRLTVGADDFGGRDRRGDEPKPRWYRTWWGVSLLIGGGVVVTGVILALTAPGANNSPDSLVITNPHWNDGASALAGFHW